MKKISIKKGVYMNEKRIRLLQDGEKKSGMVLYWMSRDQRAHDNWALNYAYQQAKAKQAPLAVVFTLVDEFQGATLRQFGFMLRGLIETAEALHKKNIPFYLLSGSPKKSLPDFVTEKNVALLISDFDPLKIKRLWKRDVAKKIAIPFYEVDAHNIVPALVASDKTEFAARTIRPKIHRLLPEYLDEFPEIPVYKENELSLPQLFDPDEILNTLALDTTVKEVDWIHPGEKAAIDTLEYFIETKLHRYDTDRNDPNKDAQSNLSPYFHFGQIAPQRVALEVSKRYQDDDNKKAFLEEMIVRRELSDNYCYFNTKYDSFEGFHEWAKKTLNDHRNDTREYVYDVQTFEDAATDDDLWNAAQKEMKTTGKMHGFMRMYWAKKILEWTESPEKALEIAIYLNDKYELDGRDPNGYTGIAWSIGGVHDRAWTERPVFGKVRFMNYNGCKRKFDVQNYIKRFT